MDRTVLITGATGLIGAALVRHFSSVGDHVVAAVRDVDKSRRMFGSLSGVETVFWDVTEPFGGSVPAVDWIVHAASETSSVNFVGHPVETIRTILSGAENVLRFAAGVSPSSVLFLSTMEVYGSPTVEVVAEGDYGYLDPVEVRSCYPEAKRMAENMCCAYAREYGVPVKIARLTQTFGEGVKYDDGRVFAEFARAILERRDIVLKTPGSTARCYCYIGDAVAAVETILAKGEVAVPYTVANEDTFCTIREMAEALVAKYPESGSRVVFDFSDSEKRGFAPPFRMKLDCSRLRALGWRPKVGLMEAFDWMMKDMQKQ